MSVGYCEPEDVRTALQEASLGGAISSAIIEDDIIGVSEYLRSSSNRHWYDSTAAASDVTSSGPQTASTVRLDLPSSPHAQRDQVHRGRRDIRYPVTVDGPYARVPLPHAFVEQLTKLEVRDRDGDRTDWTSASEYVEGVGEDYYVQEEDKEGHGASYLYVRASSVGARHDYEGLVTAAYDYGLDEQEEAWGDVRRGVALMTAAQVVVDDDVLTSIPDNGQLVGVDTQAQRLMDRGMRYLEPYL